VTNGTKIVFDTCAVIKLIDGEYDLASLGFNIDETAQFTSVIARMELLSKPDITPEEEQDIRQFLADVIVNPLDDPIEQKTIEIRRATKIKLPDCIIAATAIVLGAILLTDDPHLVKFSWPGYSVKSILPIK
jgi:predicted nucleic acid-binding protein